MKIKLIEKKDEAKGTVTFTFQPETEVKWIPGQYYYYTIKELKYPDSRGDTRHFTISSSPTEGGNLRVTTRIREESGFKKTLNELPIGTEIEGEGPNGTFELTGEETGPQVFVAGGIGITPFRTMIKYAHDKGLKIPLYLIYSNSDSDFVFGTELKEIDSADESIKVEFYDSSVSGHLDETKIPDILKKWQLDIANCTFWVCGPPAMIDAMEQVLEKLNIVSDHIKSEKFTGY